MSSLSAPEPRHVGRYEAIRVLGQGAMGKVLLAHDPVLDREVAIKLLRSDLGVAPDQRAALLERMRHEARACARLTHPNLVALHDLGEDGEHGLHLVFEYVQGTTLQARVAQGRLPPARVALLAQALGDALSTAHAAGVVHRDVKPENVILTGSGAKLTDFGIARVPESTLTHNGSLLGTPAYSAPEAISEGTFSAASDQFSLAVTLWEALCGRRAYLGQDAVAVAHRITTEAPPRLPETLGFAPSVECVFQRAFSKSPADRFPDCHDFGCALAEALGTAPRRSFPTLPDALHCRAAARRRNARIAAVAVLGAVAGIVLAVVGSALLDRLRDSPEPTDAAAQTPAPTRVSYVANRPSTRPPSNRVRSARDAGAARVTEGSETKQLETTRHLDEGVPPSARSAHDGPAPSGRASPMAH